MNQTVSRPVTAQGRPVDRSAPALGPLRRTASDTLDARLLRAGLENDGYIYLVGFLAREEVLAARHDILVRLAAAGFLDEGSDPDEARPSADAGRSMLSDIAWASKPLQELLYSGRMMGLYEALFEVPVRHFDFTWLRAYPPGRGTAPHMDNVFMSRGSSRLLSAWVPLGDIDTSLGGLAVLEGSHRLDDIRRSYASRRRRHVLFERARRGVVRHPGDHGLERPSVERPGRPARRARAALAHKRLRGGRRGHLSNVHDPHWPRQQQ